LQYAIISAYLELKE